jgi:G6PDH family F420-dependent oxidoreductase
MRIHPVILAQATATTGQLLDGRFTWGVGTGEALNEHITGERWPIAPDRIDMLEEAIELIRQLWTGDDVTFDGDFFTVENARIFDPPSSDIPIVVSAFGPEAAKMAGRIGDGLWTGGDAEIVETWAESGGSGPVYSQVNVSWDRDADAALDRAHRLWPNSGVPGQLSQDLPTPQHFEQASSIVTREMIAGSVPCGSDVGAVVDAIREVVDAGVDHVYVHQIGDDQETFFEAWTTEIAPALGKAEG